MNKKRNKEELSRVDIVLTAQERAILNDESAELTKLYIALSERRDFITGIAGLRTRISGQALREVMGLTGRQGRPKKMISNGQIRDWLRQLKSIGLIIDKGRYIFELPFSLKNKSISEKYDRSMTGGMTGSMTDIETEKISIITEENQQKNDLENRSMTGGMTGSLREVAPPQEISEYTKLNNAREGFSEFMSYMGSLGFDFSKLHNRKTVLMLHGWLDAGVSMSDLKIGVESCNAKFGGLPSHPTYYLEAVLQVPIDRLLINGKINDEQRREPNRSSRQSERDLDDEAQRKINAYLNSGN